MQPVDDNTLLRQYAEHNSGDAFAALVERHVNLVYSVALRQVGNPHQAEEIVQAVFIVLAAKAARLGEVKALSSWLFHTTRWTANNFVRGEIRRHRREQEAHVQSVLNDAGTEVWPKIAPMLDTAVAALGEQDRHAIVLRFYEGRNIREVGQALGASESAAEKRIARAVEKLQRYFSRRGIDSTADALTQSITAHSVQAAPVALAKTVAAAALAKGVAAGGSTFTFGKAALFLMKTKTVVVTVAATALILATGAYFLTQSGAARTARAGLLPVKLANASFQPFGDDHFLIDTDSGNKRRAGSAPAGHIKCLVEPASPGAAELLAATNAANRKLAASRYVNIAVTNGSPLFGQHIRITGWIKTKDVQSWVGAILMVGTADKHACAFEDMSDRPIRGTTDWQQIEWVTDTPSQPCHIYFAPRLFGAGELWCDDFQIDVAPRDLPITDDRKWHAAATDPLDFTVTTDPVNVHNGRPTICIVYAPEGAGPAHAYMWWGQEIHAPEKYRGHTVRLTGWVKTENVTGRLEPSLRPTRDPNRLIAHDSMRDDYSLTGTLGWTRFSDTCKIPEKTQVLDVGFGLSGGGTVWIDKDSLKYDIAD